MNKTREPSITLRQTQTRDLSTFFKHQEDPVANHMAAFTSKEPANREAFLERWTRLLANESILKRTILFKGRVAGSVLSFEREGDPEVCYWIGRQYWGKGIATAALSELLTELKRRPVFARVAKDNLASIRVLEKCGFVVCGHERGFANARGAEIDELVMKLRRPRKRAAKVTKTRSRV